MCCLYISGRSVKRCGSYGHYDCFDTDDGVDADKHMKITRRFFGNENSRVNQSIKTLLNFNVRKFTPKLVVICKMPKVLGDFLLS